MASTDGPPSRCLLISQEPKFLLLHPVSAVGDMNGAVTVKVNIWAPTSWLSSDIDRPKASWVWLPELSGGGFPQFAGPGLVSCCYSSWALYRMCAHRRRQSYERASPGSCAFTELLTSRLCHVLAHLSIVILDTRTMTWM